MRIITHSSDKTCLDQLIKIEQPLGLEHYFKTSIVKQVETAKSLYRVEDDMKWLTNKIKPKEMDEFEIEYWKRNKVESESMEEDDGRDDYPHPCRLNKQGCWNYIVNRNESGEPIPSRSKKRFVKYDTFRYTPGYEKDPRFKKMMVLYEQRKDDLEKARQKWIELHPKTFKKMQFITKERQKLTNNLRKERIAMERYEKKKPVVCDEKGEDDEDAQAVKMIMSVIKRFKKSNKV